MSSRSISSAAALCLTLSLAALGCGDDPSPADAGTDTGVGDGGVNPDAGGGLHPLGTICSVGGTCASGQCVDGVCCDSACDGTCEACVLSQTGEAAGTCAPILANQDPEDECGTDECGTGFCDGAGACAPVAAGQTCRDANGACDVAELCDGSSAACPADGFVSAGTECRAATGVCDVAESCLGDSPDCPSDDVQADDTVCRPAAGPCDVDDLCDGQNKACPTDAFMSFQTLCRSAVNACDTDDYCSGTSAACTDSFMGGAISTCAPYRCSTTAPMCRASCTSTSECATGAACMAGMCVPARRVFVTSTLHRADFGGLAQADAICQARAQAANVPGTFRAWISDSNTSAAMRLEHFNGPYYRLYNGVAEIVADNWADLTDGSLDRTLGITEYGQVRNATEGVGITGDSAWTGTAANGTATTLNCGNWTIGTSPTTGTNGTNGGNVANWTSDGALYCQYALRLYCFEQNPIPPG